MDRILEKKKWHQKRSFRIGLLLTSTILILYLVVFVYFRMGQRVSVDRLTISTVTESEFQELIAATGIVQPIRTIYLDVVEGGRVEEIFAEDGQELKAGQPILRMANSNLVLDIMYREAQLYEQENNLRNTRISMDQRRLDLQIQLNDLNYEASKQARDKLTADALHNKNLISTQEYRDIDDKASYLAKRRDLLTESALKDSSFRAEQVRQLEESMKRMENNLELVKKNQENLIVRSPIDGQLSALSAEIGQTKPQGQRLGQIDDMTAFKIRATIDEHYVARVTLGKRASFSFNGKEWQLEVKKIYPEVKNGQFEVDLAFVKEVPDGIRRGQSVQLSLALSDPAKALILQRGGYFNSTGGQWVFVLDKSGTRAHRRTVKFGRQNLTEYEILDGLLAGESVITSQYDGFLSSNQLILTK